MKAIYYKRVVLKLL